MWANGHSGCVGWLPTPSASYIDATQKGQPPLQAALLLAGVLSLTGAVVGAIHGAFLVRLAGQTTPA